MPAQLAFEFSYIREVTPAFESEFLEQPNAGGIPFQYKGKINPFARPMRILEGVFH
jgi:hypothetical protein